MHPSQFMQPQIVLLKQGTDTSQGKAQLISNINACQAVVDVVRTTLGPRGMDKLIHDDQGKVTISNDGATIMKLLQIVHPAAVTLVQVGAPQPPPAPRNLDTVLLRGPRCSPFYFPAPLIPLFLFACVRRSPCRRMQRWATARRA